MQNCGIRRDSSIFVLAIARNEKSISYYWTQVYNFVSYAINFVSYVITVQISDFGIFRIFSTQSLQLIKFIMPDSGFVTLFTHPISFPFMAMRSWGIGSHSLYISYQSHRENGYSRIKLIKL